VLKIASIVLNNFKNDSRVLKTNISLQNAGYCVEVIALWEEGVDEFETIQNVPVHRVKLKSKNWSKNKLVQLVKYFELMYIVVKKYKNSDVFHCNDLNALPIGVLVKLFFNQKMKIVYDAHEYETEINGLDGVQKKATKLLEKLLIKYTSRVICVSDAIANEYVKLYNIKKPDLVLNTPIYQEVEKKDIFRETFNIPKEKTIFLYQGGLSSGRGIEILLETLKTIGNKNVVIVFMGYGPLESLVKDAANEYDNIYFHNAVSPEVLLNYTSSADFGILFYENNCLNHYYCSPNKMFEYIMAGIPVIASNLYEMKRLVKNNKIGVVAPQNTVQGLRVAIEEAVKLNKQELQENLQRVKEIYNWKEQEKILLKLYRALYED